MKKDKCRRPLPSLLYYSFFYDIAVVPVHHLTAVSQAITYPEEGEEESECEGEEEYPPVDGEVLDQLAAQPPDIQEGEQVAHTPLQTSRAHCGSVHPVSKDRISLKKQPPKNIIEKINSDTGIWFCYLQISNSRLSIYVFTKCVLYVPLYSV